MKKLLIFIFVLALCTSFTNSPQGSPVEKGIPLFYTAWSDWGGGITFDQNQIQWNIDTRNWIKAVPGTYVSTHSESTQPCAECTDIYRYQMCYFKNDVLDEK
jgi:hypothetical protein